MNFNNLIANKKIPEGSCNGIPFHDIILRFSTSPEEWDNATASVKQNINEKGKKRKRNKNIIYIYFLNIKLYNI